VGLELSLKRMGAKADATGADAIVTSREMDEESGTDSGFGSSDGYSKNFGGS
jgi:uncharacterized protein YbjQ (UPF0145 family)